MMLRPTPEQRSDRPGSDTPIIERLRYVMGNADPSRRLHIEQTAADALHRILELEAALRDAYPFVCVSADQYRRDYGLEALHETHAEIADRIAKLIGSERMPSEVLR